MGWVVRILRLWGDRLLPLRRWFGGWIGDVWKVLKWFCRVRCASD